MDFGWLVVRRLDSKDVGWTQKLDPKYFCDFPVFVLKRSCPMMCLFLESGHSNEESIKVLDPIDGTKGFVTGQGRVHL